jgi:hypothetical protein
VIPHATGTPRQLLVLACTAAALAAALLGRYAAHTVRPDCLVAVSTLTDGDGRPLPDANGRVWSSRELANRAYRQAVGSGRCDPPRARWKQWLH